MPEAEPRPRAALRAIEPKHLAGIATARAVELHPKLYAVPHPPIHTQRRRVGFGSVTVAPPARDAVRFSGHVRVVRIEPRRPRVARLLGDEQRREEVCPLRAGPGLAEGRPL